MTPEEPGRSEGPGHPEAPVHPEIADHPEVADHLEGSGRPEGTGRSVRELWRRATAFHDELFMAPWRAGVRREGRRQEDLLVALVFCEAFGIENPAAYHTLELYPELIAAYHDWHLRQGLESAPHHGVCC